MERSFHQPRRPSWRCRSCGAPWPCPPRKAEFSHEFATRLALALYLGPWLRDAIEDHPDRSGELVRRFIQDVRSVRFAERQRSALTVRPDNDGGSR